MGELVVFRREPSARVVRVGGAVLTVAATPTRSEGGSGLMTGSGAAHGQVKATMCSHGSGSNRSGIQRVDQIEAWSAREGGERVGLPGP